MSIARQTLDALRNILFKACSVNILQKRDENRLTFLQRSILTYLNMRESASMVELSRVVCISKPAMTRVIDTLERKKLVRREASPDDRRSYRIILTVPGRRIVATLDTLPLAAMERLLKSCTTEERRLIVHGLGVFLKKLEMLKS